MMMMNMNTIGPSYCDPDHSRRGQHASYLFWYSILFLLQLIPFIPLLRVGLLGPCVGSWSLLLPSLLLL